MVKKSKGKFLKITCPKCRTKHLVFGKASIKVKCTKCNYKLIETSGGKAKVKAKVKEVIWK
jgi:ribosomal protein S27E